VASEVADEVRLVEPAKVCGQIGPGHIACHIDVLKHSTHPQESSEDARASTTRRLPSASGNATFISIGYVIASFARTEEAANGMTSVVQFPLMFLSGIFFPIALMPSFLQPVAALLQMTYLADALRQVMAGGVPFAPLWADGLILGAWLIASFLISARYFRWES